MSMKKGKQANLKCQYERLPQYALVLLELTLWITSCCLLALSHSVSSHNTAWTVSVAVLACSLWLANTSTGSKPAAYPYVICMRVNMQDYSYQLSSKWYLAGMLKLISVCENVSMHWSLLVIQQSFHVTELLLGSANDGVVLLPCHLDIFFWRAKATQWQITLHCGQWNLATSWQSHDILVCGCQARRECWVETTN